MTFVVYLAEQKLPVILDVGAVAQAGDLVAAGAAHGSVRGELLAADGRVLEVPCPVSIPFESVRRIERQMV